MLRERFVLGLLAAAASTAATSQRGVDTCVHNDALPYDRQLDINMRVLDGPEFKLSDYLGYAVWLNIFATWCGPCIKEQSFVVRASQEYYSSGLRIVGIDFMESDVTVRTYRQKYEIPYPIAMDQQGGFIRALETGTKDKDLHFPSHLLITPQGRLDCYVAGSLDEDTINYKLGILLTGGSASPRPT